MVFLTKFWRFWDVLPICDLPQGALAMMMVTGRENVTVKKDLYVFKHCYLTDLKYHMYSVCK